VAWKRKKRRKRAREYTPHSITVKVGGLEVKVSLTPFQEFIMTEMRIAGGYTPSELAWFFFRSGSAVAKVSACSVIRTGIAFRYEIMKRENFWCTPGEARWLRSLTFDKKAEGAEADHSLADCTGIWCQGSSTMELLINQLMSPYYGKCCGKVLAVQGAIGNCMYVSETWGGPASDKAIFRGSSDLIEQKKWARKPCLSCPVGSKQCKCRPPPKMNYDAGVDAEIRAMFAQLYVELVTSGMPRNDADAAMSVFRRLTNLQRSALRMHVEDLMGQVKQKCKILVRQLASTELAQMHKIVFISFMMHNFLPQTIK
jgi:hypothetical protein